MTTGLFWTLFAGFILGMLTNAFLPMGRKTGALALGLTCAVGIVGALVASLAGQGLRLWDQEQIGAFVAALVGAAVLLAVVRHFMGARPAV